MFNLEQSIADWRRQMLAAGVKNPVPLVELESHLRDEIEQLTRAGLDEAAAFQTATQKVGVAPAIQNEFNKVEIARADRQWPWKRVALLGFSTVFPVLVASQIFYFKTGNMSGLTLGQKTSCLAALQVFSLLAWGGQLGHRWFPVIPAKRTRDVITMVCVGTVTVWWVVLFNVIIPRYDLNPGQLIVMVLWGFIAPGGIQIGLATGIETALRRHQRITTA